jgi:hypothetical protein
VAANSQPLVLPDPADAREWRPRFLYFAGAAAMAAGAFGPWLAGKFSGNTAGITLGGDGWILVAAAGIALVPLLVRAERGAAGLWAILMAVAGAAVCFVHIQQAQMDGFKNGWGLYAALVGCGVLAWSGLLWLRASSRMA